MTLKLRSVFDVTKIFLSNMNRYPSLFWVINGTRNISDTDSDALSALVGKAMSDADVDAAMAILDKYRTNATATHT
jgi:hypothetical protein